MSCLLARKGRDKQRYKDQLRLVAGKNRCIPYKLEKGGVDDQNCDMEDRLLVLMISTPNRDDLVFPKGGWEDDETISEAACREALEEAGVKGILSENPLGVWEWRSKSRQNGCSLEGGCRGHMFALEVTEELESWPEQAIYQRNWLTTEEAFKLCRYDWMRDALREFLTALSTSRIKGTRGLLIASPSTIPVTDTGTGSQILSPGCPGEPSSVQNLDNACTKSVIEV